MHSSALFLAPLAALAAAKTITVQVGASGLSFSPDSVTAAAGDELNFMISPGHSVAQANFDAPCKPSGGSAIYSGKDAQTFVVTVKDSSSMWFYCTTPDHCSAGMVMAVNPT
jgi:plastocyanin